MRVKLFVVCWSLLISGCAVTKDWVATGGSRSDGVVRLSFEHGSLESPTTNDQQAVSLAAQRCKTWGYQGAEAFGGVTRQCNMRSGFGCDRWLITKEFQCTGEVKSTK